MTTIIKRRDFLKKIHAAFQVNPVVALLGPRQCGKTTLAQLYVAKQGKKKQEISYFDLELPADLARLDSPVLAIDNSADLIVIDEIQQA